MGKISLLDCTLRDGGYVNDWEFGEEAIKSIGRKIIQAGIEFFEVGFIKNVEYDKNRTVFSCVEDIKDMIYPKNPEVMYVGMIDMGAPVPLEKICEYDDSSVDALRIIFKKNKIDEAYEYCSAIKEKGYKVFIQPVGTDSYTDMEFIQLIHRFNGLNPWAFYIVDTFGMIKKKQFMRLVYLADNNLAAGITLGYHSHNNLQQAFGNAEAMTEINMQRNIMIDACVFGMGRGAGNLNMELFAEYMNENFGKNYRLEPMLEIIDEFLNEIYSHNFWGYSLPFYLSASTMCHPNYAITYAKKGTLTVKSFHELLKSISEEDKVVFSPEKAEQYYLEYQKNYIDDRETMKQLEHEMGQRDVLILAPGKRLEESNKIKELIADKSPVIIAVNFCPTDYHPDYIFSSNMRRYHKMENEIDTKKIITSNMKEAKSYDYLLNFASYACKDSEILDNSGLMLINILVELGIKNIFLAGFDGYDWENKKNYINSGLEYVFSNEMMERRNRLIRRELCDKQKNVALTFVTSSQYENNEEE